MREVEEAFKTSIRAREERINIELEKGEFIAITGKSGSGKSTLAKSLGGEHFEADQKVARIVRDFLVRYRIRQHYCR